MVVNLISSIISGEQLLSSTLKVNQNSINESENKELKVYGSPHTWGS